MASSPPAPKPRRRARRSQNSAPGAPPGTLTPVPDAAPSRISVFAYGPDDVVEDKSGSLERVPDLLARFPVVWVDIDGLADVAAIRKVGEIFGLHPLALEDVLNPVQRPKAEWYERYCYCVLRIVYNVERVFSTEQLNLFVGANFVLTVQERPGDCFDPVRSRLLRAGSRHRTSGADYLAYSLLDTGIDSYFPVLEHYGEELDRVEHVLVGAPTPAVMENIQHLRRDLLEFRRAVWPLREVISGLQREDSPIIKASTRPYLRDCHDHAIQIVDLLETYRELGADLMDVYLSSVSNRMNEVMKVLTIIATIFIPMTFIASIYGMNFDDMPELHRRWGYPFALGLMALVGGGLAYWFKRRGWFK